MSDHVQTVTLYCLGTGNLLCGVSRIDAQNFMRCRQIRMYLYYLPYLLVLVMLWEHDLMM